MILILNHYQKGKSSQRNFFLIPEFSEFGSKLHFFTIFRFIIWDIYRRRKTLIQKSPILIKDYSTNNLRFIAPIFNHLCFFLFWTDICEAGRVTFFSFPVSATGENKTGRLKVCQSAESGDQSKNVRRADFRQITRIRARRRRSPNGDCFVRTSGNTNEWNRNLTNLDQLELCDIF